MTKKSAPPIEVIEAKVEEEIVLQGSVFQAGDDEYRVELAPVARFTGDDRIIFDLGWREGRLPFTFSDSEQAHGDAVHVGNMDNFRYEEIDSDQWVVADLEWDTDELAVEAKRMVDEDKIRGVSIHLGAGWSVWFCRDSLSETPTKEEVLEAAERFFGEDEWETCEREGMGVFDAEVGAATMVLIPAFEDAHVEPVLAAAQEVADLMSPPHEWFENPDLDKASGLKISKEGRVSGHIAFWDSCHRGFRGECKLAPHSTSYDEFHKNATLSFGDDELGVGCLTLDLNHADVRASLSSAKDHYDHSGTVLAFVRAGEDEHGVWVSGALAPGLPEDRVEVARRMRLSGDWRPTEKGYELIAAQSVPVPGFVPRALVASGEMQTVGPESNPFSELTNDALVASALLRLSEQVESAMEMLRPIHERELRQQFDAAVSEFDSLVDHASATAPIIES